MSNNPAGFRAIMITTAAVIFYCALVPALPILLTLA
jgi:hypothetical protein